MRHSWLQAIRRSAVSLVREANAGSLEHDVGRKVKDAARKSVVKARVVVRRFGEKFGDASR